MIRLLRNVFWFIIGISLAVIMTFATNVAFAADPIVTESTTDSTVRTEGNMNTTINQPPPSAISPQFSGGSNSDLCTIGVAGAVQTQILGISAGTTFTEDNCIRLKNAKTLYDMGMKVAAVSVMCQDPKVFQAMMHAGTPCPYMGKIGAEAQLAWESHVEQTEEELRKSDELSNTQKGAMGVGGLAALLLLL
jgi:hypothetical protein